MSNPHCRRRPAPLHGYCHNPSVRSHHDSVIILWFPPISGSHATRKPSKKTLCYSTASYFKMVNGTCVDKEPNTLAVSFLKILSTRSELLWWIRTGFAFLFILGIKTVCHRTWCTLRRSLVLLRYTTQLLSSLRGCVCECKVNRELTPLSTKIILTVLKTSACSSLWIVTAAIQMRRLIYFHLIN